MSQSNHNFVLKSGLEAGGQLIVNAQGELVAPISGNTLPDVGTAGTYGDSAKRVSVTLDAKGRVSAVTELPIPVLSVNDTGGDGALSYNASTGVLTYTGPSATEVRASLSAVDAGGDGSLSYDAATGAFTFTGPSALEVRAHLSAGGDLAYNATTGVISFTERTDAEVRGLISAGTGISYDSATGVISAGQATGAGDDVEFNNLVLAGDLTVNGTTTTVNSTTVTINDPLLHLADSNDASDVLDMGFVSHYSDGIDQMHTGLFRDATTQKYHLFQGLTQDLESTNVVDIADASFAAAPLVAGAIEVDSVTSAGAISGTTLTGIYQGFDSDLSARSTSDVSEGDNLYYTSARADSDAKNAVSGTGSISYDPATGIISATAGAGIQAGHGLDFTAGVMSVDSSADIFINKVVAGATDPGYGSVGFETDAGNIYSKSGEIYAYNGSISSYYGDIGTNSGNVYTGTGNITLGTSAHGGYNYSRLVAHNKYLSDGAYDFGMGSGITTAFASDSVGYSTFLGNFAGGPKVSSTTAPKDTASVLIGWQAGGHALGASGYDAGSKNVVVGYYAGYHVSTSAQYKNTLIGAYSKSASNYSSSLGYKTIVDASSDHAVNIGYKALIEDSSAYTVAIGANSMAAGNTYYGVIVGAAAWIRAEAYKSTVVGYNASSLSPYGVSVGYQAAAKGSYSVSIGSKSVAQGAQSIAMGFEADAFANDVVMRTDGVDRIRFKDSDDSFSLSATSLVMASATSLEMAGTATKTGSVSTSSVTPTVLDTFAAADFRSAKFTVQTTNSTDSKYQSTEILLIHDGTNTHVTEFGTLYTGDSAEADFSAAIVSGNVELSVTAATTDAMVHKVVRHAVDA